VADLDQFLRRLDEPWVEDALRGVADRADTGGFRPFAVPSDVLAALLFYYGRAGEYELQAFDVADPIQEALFAAIEEAPDEL
jgi:hypothetical protein